MSIWKRYMMPCMAVLIGLVLSGCSGDDAPGQRNGEPAFIQAQFNFALPLKFSKPKTRMGGDVVQESSDPEDFRGLSDVKMLCFNTSETPSETTQSIGSMIEMQTSVDTVATEATTDDFSMREEIKIPVGTKYFGFYAHSADVPRNHEERMKYGIIETVGLGKDSYQDNSSIRFKPVQLCTSSDPLGGSAIGQRLFDLLNDLMSITVSDAAPNDKWSTADNLYLNEAYQRMTQLTTLSSFNVQTMLAAVNRIINLEGPDEQGQSLAAAITAKIAGACVTAPAADATSITLKPEYQGYPDDIHLPTGAARIEWDETQGKYIPGQQKYSENLIVGSVNDYVYPMNLQYQIFSDILASNNMVIQDETGEVTDQYSTWDDLLEQGYNGASKEVQQSTQSVAMVKKVEYAVGRMALRSKLDSNTLPDANGKAVNVAGGFTLKGYVIGGQREVNYNFQPVEGSTRYAIYDTDINGATPTTPVRIVPLTYTEKPDYILGLGTAPDETIKMALELVNNGADFQGADGLIVHGATFYLVAELNPTLGERYSADLSQIFDRAHATQVNLNITTLAGATYGLPRLDAPIPTVGVSVNLSWSEGMTFEETL